MPDQNWIKMRALREMPARSRYRLQYHTRRLMPGDTFEAQPASMRFLRKVGWAEVAAADDPGPAQTRPRGRPPKARAVAKAERRDQAVEPAPTGLDPSYSAEQPAEPAIDTQSEAAQPDQDENDDPFPDKSVPELREMAEHRGIELPPGYVRRDELIDLLLSHAQG